MKVDKIVITLSQCENKISSANYDFNVVDMPGLDDTSEQTIIQKYITQQLTSIVPIFIMDITTGTIDLDHFSFLKPLFTKLQVTVIFTKFLNSKNDHETKLNETTDEYEDKDILDSMTGKTLKGFQSKIRQYFPIAKFYLFDPAADYFCNEDMSQIINEEEFSELDKF